MLECRTGRMSTVDFYRTFTEQAIYLVICDLSRFCSHEQKVDGRQLESDIRMLEELGVCRWF